MSSGWLARAPRPIELLPFDILSEVFQLAADEERACFTPQPLPLAVSHVSRHWRSVALSSAGLWTLVSLELHGDAFGARKMGMLTKWLSRSQEWPLRLGINSQCTAPLSDLLILAAVLSPHLQRCRTISLLFAGDHSLLVKLKLFALRTTLPNLEELSLYSYTEGPHIPHLSFDLILSGRFPRLGQLTMAYACVTMPIRPLITPSLTSLIVTLTPAWSLGGISNILTSCPWLVKLSFDGLWLKNIQFGIAFATVELLKLEDMSLSGNARTVSNVLAMVKSPNLRRLLVATHDQSDEMPPASFRVRGPLKSLLSLSLEASTLTDRQLLSILRAAPNLTSLALGLSTSTNLVLKALASNSNAMPKMLHLKLFTISERLDMQVLEEFLQTRERSSGSRPRLNLQLPRSDANSDNIDAVRRLVDKLTFL
jgi:hypothetical protein